MKNLKKILAVVLAMVLMAAMSVTMFAVNTNGQLNDDNGINSEDTTLSIAKQIIFVNDEETAVREPNITYTYTIATTDPNGATITDKNEIVGSVKAGPLEAVAGSATATTSTIAFADTATQTATAAGTASVAKYATFTFDNSKFSAAGIYRYKITESASPAKATVGVEESGTYNAVRYLDVYVQYTDNTHTALKVYGYSLFEGADNTSIKSDDLTGGDVSMKSTGYVNTGSEGTLSDVDVYKTENLYIKKTTTGVLADLNNEFPITVTLTAPQGVTADVKFDVTGMAAINAWGTATGAVKNGTEIAIKGIPAGATASLVEKNNTVDFYKVKAGKTAGAADLLAEAIVNPDANSGATTALILANNKDGASRIEITNTLDAISPTGVIVRFAPFAIILLAGVALFVIARRRRVED